MKYLANFEGSKYLNSNRIYDNKLNTTKVTQQITERSLWQITT